eukprot:jgi/Mesvir1/24548/Mv21886-RA.1
MTQYCHASFRSPPPSWMAEWENAAAIFGCTFVNPPQHPGSSTESSDESERHRLQGQAGTSGHKTSSIHGEALWQHLLRPDMLPMAAAGVGGVAAPPDLTQFLCDPYGWDGASRAAWGGWWNGTSASHATAARRRSSSSSGDSTSEAHVKHVYRVPTDFPRHGRRVAPHRPWDAEWQWRCWQWQSSCQSRGRDELPPPARRRRARRNATFHSAAHEPSRTEAGSTEGPRGASSYGSMPSRVHLPALHHQHRRNGGDAASNRSSVSGYVSSIMPGDEDVFRSSSPGNASQCTSRAPSAGFYHDDHSDDRDDQEGDEEGEVNPSCGAGGPYSRAWAPCIPSQSSHPYSDWTAQGSPTASRGSRPAYSHPYSDRASQGSHGYSDRARGERVGRGPGAEGLLWRRDASRERSVDSCRAPLGSPDRDTEWVRDASLRSRSPLPGENGRPSPYTGSGTAPWPSSCSGGGVAWPSPLRTGAGSGASTSGGGDMGGVSVGGNNLGSPYPGEARPAPLSSQSRRRNSCSAQHRPNGGQPAEEAWRRRNVIGSCGDLCSAWWGCRGGDGSGSAGGDGGATIGLLSVPMLEWAQRWNASPWAKKGDVGDGDGDGDGRNGLGSSSGNRKAASTPRRSSGEGVPGSGKGREGSAGKGREGGVGKGRCVSEVAPREGTRFSSLHSPLTQVPPYATGEVGSSLESPSHGGKRVRRESTGGEAAPASGGSVALPATAAAAAEAAASTIAVASAVAATAAAAAAGHAVSLGMDPDQMAWGEIVRSSQALMEQARRLSRACASGEVYRAFGSSKGPQALAVEGEQDLPVSLDATLDDLQGPAVTDDSHAGTCTDNDDNENAGTLAGSHSPAGVGMGNGNAGAPATTLRRVRGGGGSGPAGRRSPLSMAAVAGEAPREEGPGTLDILADHGAEDDGLGDCGPEDRPARASGGDLGTRCHAAKASAWHPVHENRARVACGCADAPSDREGAHPLNAEGAIVAAAVPTSESMGADGGIKEAKGQRSGEGGGECQKAEREAGGDAGPSSSLSPSSQFITLLGPSQGPVERAPTCSASKTLFPAGVTSAGEKVVVASPWGKAPSRVTSVEGDGDMGGPATAQPADGGVLAESTLVGGAQEVGDAAVAPRCLSLRIEGDDRPHKDGNSNKEGSQPLHAEGPRQTLGALPVELAPAQGLGGAPSRDVGETTRVEGTDSTVRGIGYTVESAVTPWVAGTSAAHFGTRGAAPHKGGLVEGCHASWKGVPAVADGGGGSSGSMLALSSVGSSGFAPSSVASSNGASSSVASSSVALSTVADAPSAHLRMGTSFLGDLCTLADGLAGLMSDAPGHVPGSEGFGGGWDSAGDMESCRGCHRVVASPLMARTRPSTSKSCQLPAPLVKLPWLSLDKVSCDGVALKLPSPGEVLIGKLVGRRIFSEDGPVVQVVGLRPHTLVPASHLAVPGALDHAAAGAVREMMLAEGKGRQHQSEQGAAVGWFAFSSFLGISLPSFATNAIAQQVDIRPGGPAPGPGDQVGDGGGTQAAALFVILDTVKSSRGRLCVECYDLSSRSPVDFCLPE